MVAAPGTTEKVPVPVTAGRAVAATVIDCAPAIVRVAVVCPTPLVSVSGPGFTKPVSELVKVTELLKVLSVVFELASAVTVMVNGVPATTGPVAVIEKVAGGGATVPFAWICC